MKWKKRSLESRWASAAPTTATSHWDKTGTIRGFSPSPPLRHPPTGSSDGSGPSQAREESPGDSDALFGEDHVRSQMVAVSMGWRAASGSI
jgi:hypothetical protein